MLSPSDNLSNSLIELQLCTAQQLTSCEPEVRQLAGDLPGFDSCWLDVLVAHRLLTPWQAERLQTDDPLPIRQGRYRLREPLGQRTWQAETFDRSRLVVLSRLVDHDRQATEQLTARARAQVEVANTNDSLIPTSVCLPREYLADESGDGGWIVSPYVPGWSLDELLIRGGRLPWQVVVEIGSAILHGLHGLQQQDLNHGDISLRNVRLQPSGEPVLVDPFTARWLNPSIGFRADLRLRDIQYCAPELVGSGRRNDAVSDLYSVGTILWQLLTSRPTFIAADPVTFLMESRERDVEDVRLLVPDCPDEVAYQIQLLTRRRPELRPQTSAAALGPWSELSGTRFSATRRLLRRLPDRSRVAVAPHPTLSRRRLLQRGWVVAAVAGCVMVGLSSSLVPLPLNLRRTAATDAAVDRPVMSSADDEIPRMPTDETQPLPVPSADGVIQLIGGQTYEARSLQKPGTLRIRSEGDSVAVIEVPNRSSWKISTDQLQLSGIQIRFRGDHVVNAQRLLDVYCRVLELDRTIVGDRRNHHATGLRWTPVADGSSVVRVLNTVFLSGRYAIHTTTAPGHFVLRNVLFEAAETAWRCDSGGLSHVQLNMAQVTQVGGNSFADIIRGEGTATLHVDFVCGESVLTPAQAIVRLASTAREWNPHSATLAFRLASRANPTIMLPSVNPVVWFDQSLNQNVALPESQVLSESLLMAEPEFDSSAVGSNSFGSARVMDFDGPKRGQQLPGVDVKMLPSLPSFPENTGGE